MIWYFAFLAAATLLWGSIGLVVWIGTERRHALDALVLEVLAEGPAAFVDIKDRLALRESPWHLDQVRAALVRLERAGRIVVSNEPMLLAPFGRAALMVYSVKEEEQ